MNLFNKELNTAFSEKSVLKVISGLDNINIYKIIKLAKMSELAGATYIDVAAKPSIVSALKPLVTLPICVSSISSIELYNCALAGADILEIGNFDTFYNKNIFLSYETIVKLAYETRVMVKDKDICVTIPNHLNLSKQLKLAKQLERMDINIVQTEGCSSKNNTSLRTIDNYHYDFFTYSTNLTSSTLSSTYAISQETNLPVITASGLNAISSTIAMFYGASGVGVGTSISNYINNNYMLKYIQEIICNIKKYNNTKQVLPLIYSTSVLNQSNYI